jgi:hypothetical protein
MGQSEDTRTGIFLRESGDDREKGRYKKVGAILVVFILLPLSSFYGE